ncbi:DUF2986 domain-containing protein [Shewanella sp. SR44-3]|uniref:DUF2986 domain-containing protein n=1 Tax=unclassified Shewanella TaxID=196818 RepID=UPI0015F89479|nr:DUF2986 domain-containing protein [Shewanella sp. SR44-3]MBB1268792.1 DUF2986 domain-containing protein [Shewanella sp. SR44-3]
MNRKKKINQTLKAKAKKANAKKAGIPANKPKYVAKADRDQVDASMGVSDSARVEVSSEAD